MSVSDDTRNGILRLFSDLVTYKQYPFSFDYLYQLEYAALSNVKGMSSTDKAYYLSLLRSELDPLTYSLGDAEYYQFALLDKGYSGSSEDILNRFIATHGASGKLSAQGAAFIDAARTYGINEVYLLSHAILESGWGSSQLALGFSYDGSSLGDGRSYPAGTYYNFYGIGAVDSSPYSGGRALAIKEGWNSPYAAISGAAKWIKSQYVANSYGPQNTLHKMRWDLYHVSQGSSPWKQYATSTTWATGIASVMYSFYRFAGVDIASTGLTFELPSFR